MAACQVAEWAGWICKKLVAGVAKRRIADNAGAKHRRFNRAALGIIRLVSSSTATSSAM